MPSSDAHLPKVQHQQQQTNSRTKDAVGENSVLNQTAFTDAREAAMLSQTSNTTKVDNSTRSQDDTLVNGTNTLPTNVSSATLTNTTQQQVTSDKSHEEDTDQYSAAKDDKVLDSGTPAKKKHRKKPRIIFHPEDECRISSKPSDDDDIVADEEIELEQKVSSDEISKQEETSSSTSSEENNRVSSTSKSPSSVSATAGSQQKYTDSYQSSEFRPYNPLSHSLEERLFPRPFGPANFFSYPSWPDKTECLDVVENLSSWVKSSRMDIDMAKRGHE